MEFLAVILIAIYAVSQLAPQMMWIFCVIPIVFVAAAAIKVTIDSRK